MPSSVSWLTPAKPTEMIVMPLSLRIWAFAMAAAEPPYSALCSPSLSTSTTFMYTLASTMSRYSLASIKPAPMLVELDVG